MNLFSYLMMWLSDLLDSLVPEYKVVEYYAAIDAPVWGIDKRHYIFSYKALTHLKYVRYITQKTTVSHAILTYPTLEAAESEIDRLLFGYPPVVSRLWERGIQLEEHYESHIYKD